MTSVIENTPFALARPDITLAAETAGAGRNVLLLHAGGETRAVWRPVMGVLAEHGLRSEAYDQRGHGDSGGAASDGVQAFGEDAKAMIRRSPNSIVAGGSLGGFALMHVLEECEAQAAGLVLIDVTPSPDPERTRKFLAPRGGLGASPLVDDILSQSDRFTGIVEKLRLPILLVCGGARSPIDQKARDAFAKLCPHAEIKVIEDAGHLVARDAPLELATLIAGFARRITAD